jgi:futalosine hydrolase
LSRAPAKVRDGTLAEIMPSRESLTHDCDLLILAAFAPELAELEAILPVQGEALASEVGGILVCVATVGIGLVEAAIGTGSRLRAGKPRAVVLIGTCGAYPETELSIGDVVVARSALLVEPGVVLGRAALPEAMIARVNALGPITGELAARGARVVDVATTLAITTDDTLARELATRGEVEHLEAFAVASACAKETVQFAAVFGVANRVGSRGRSEWRTHHRAASGAAASHVRRWIEAGAPGVRA